jgi:signal transduction histidine kinase
MKEIKFSFKSKILIPLIIIFSIATLIISWNFYRSLESYVITSTDEKLDIFTDNILTQVLHLDLILESTTEILAQNHMAISRAVAQMFDDPNKEIDMSIEGLQRFQEPFGINAIAVTDNSGTIVYTSIPEWMGFNYGTFEQTSIYMQFLDGTITELQESPRRSVLDFDETGSLNHYTGLIRAGGGFYQISFDVSVIFRLQDEINIERAINEAILGYGGYGFVLHDGIIAAHFDSNMSGRDVSGEDWYEVVTTGSGFAWLDINGSRYYAGFRNADGHTVVGLIPYEDYFRELNQAFRSTVLVFVIALVSLIAGVYFLVNRLLRPIKNVTGGLGEIATGNLDARITGNYNDEFGLIQDAVNNMAANLTAYLNDKLQAERLAHEAEIEQLELRDFITSIAHDLKTPLSVLSLNLEALNNLAVNNAEYQRHTRVAYQKSQDLQRLIQNLFEVNLIERGKVAYNFKKISMLRLLAEARGRYDDYLEDKGITFEISAPDDDMYISIDRQRIWSVFDNIIYNAARYTPHGGAITVSGGNRGGNAVIAITDTGCGIPAEHLPRIFERFYKVSQSRGEKDGDSGLGLYIVKNIMDGHGGSVTAVSEVEKGTAIVLTFS